MKVQIFDKVKQQLIDAEIIEENTHNPLVRRARLLTENREIGRIIYFFSKDHVNIQMIHNDNPQVYGKVGTELVNYAFDLSVTHGKQGKIQLSPVPSSIGFWEKLGFEFNSNKKDMRLKDEVIQSKLNSEEYKLNKAQKWANEQGFQFKSFK